MAGAKYVIDVENLLGEIRKTLRKFVGFAASEIMEVSWVIPGCLDYRYVGDQSVLQMLIDQGLPSGEASSLIEYVQYEMDCIIKLTIGEVEPGERVLCNSMPGGDIYIYKTPRLVAARIDPMHEYKQAVLKSIENGDWHSEQLRRLVGLP